MMSLVNISIHLAEHWLAELAERGIERSLAVRVVHWVDSRDVRVRDQWRVHYQLSHPKPTDDRIYDFRIDFDSDFDRMDQLWTDRARLPDAADHAAFEARKKWRREAEREKRRKSRAALAKSRAQSVPEQIAA